MNYPATPYQSFEDQSGRAEGVSSNNRNDNGGLKSSPSLVDSLHPDDIPSSEFISGLDTYRSLTNTVTSVPTHPTFRLRVSEYSTKRKHSFVRFSKKFKQAKVCQTRFYKELVPCWGSQRVPDNLSEFRQTHILKNQNEIPSIYARCLFLEITYSLADNYPLQQYITM